MRTRIPAELFDAVRYFADPVVCREFLASARWPDGVTCPRKGCGGKEHWFINTRGLWRCKSCKKQFSAKVGSIFEDSPLGLDKWLPAVWLLTASKKGYSSHRLAAAIDVCQKTAWFMLHRVRHALAAGSFEAPLSGEVEVDESFLGAKERFDHETKRLHRGAGPIGKAAVLGLLERHGELRAKTVSNICERTLQEEVRANVAADSTVYSNALRSYTGLERDYAHEVIDHAETFAKGRILTDGIENFRNLFNHTIDSTHEFVRPWQLDRYLGDANFRFNNRNMNDGARFALACSQADRRPLTFKELTGKEDGFRGK